MPRNRNWNYKLLCVLNSEVVDAVDGRVRSCRIDVENLGLLDVSFDEIPARISEMRAAGWEGFTDYTCESQADRYSEYPVAQVRLWRRATDEEKAAYDEYIRQRNAAAELAQLERERAELARLKAKLGEK